MTGCAGIQQITQLARRTGINECLVLGECHALYTIKDNLQQLLSCIGSGSWGLLQGNVFLPYP